MGRSGGLELPIGAQKNVNLPPHANTCSWCSLREDPVCPYTWIRIFRLIVAPAPASSMQVWIAWGDDANQPRLLQFQHLLCPFSPKQAWKAGIQSGQLKFCKSNPTILFRGCNSRHAVPAFLALHLILSETQLRRSIINCFGRDGKSKTP